MINRASYRLPNLDYNNLNRTERQNVAQLTEKMNRVLDLVQSGQFESLVTVDQGIEHLRSEAQRLGTDLPESFVREVKGQATTVALERSEQMSKVNQWMRRAEGSLQRSDRSYWRFSQRIHNYCESHGLKQEAINALDERAESNPFLFEGDQGAGRVSRGRTRTANPFETS